MNLEESNQKIQLVVSNIEKVIKDKRSQILRVLTCLIAGGHVLMEDNPGTGKTLLAKTLAKSISYGDGKDQFSRIQFTPDLLPLDLIGSYIFNDNTKEFVFHKGPVFTEVLLADEINRASPKVQSALLEAMEERQVSLGNTTYKLDELFFTIATQNPVEMEGTYPLPAAQLDRFFMKIYFGYVDRENELDIYRNYQEIENNQLSTAAVISDEDIIAMRNLSNTIQVHEEILTSVTNIVRATREDPGILLGASPRAGITFLKCIRTYAMMMGRSYAIEDDIKSLCDSVLAHRLVFKNQDAKGHALNRILDQEMDRLTKVNIS